MRHSIIERPLVHLVRGLLLLGLVLRAASASGTGWVIRQTRPQGLVEITIADAGAKVVFPEGPTPQDLSSLGAVVRYDANRLLLLDTTAHTYQEVPLTQAIAARGADAALAKKITAGSVAEIGTPPTVGKRRRVRLHALARRLRIGTLTARGYLLRDGATTYRLWYARGVPAPPRAIAKSLGVALAKGGRDSIGRALRRLATKLLVRAELREGHSWRTVIDTTSATQAEVAADTFEAPAGWQAVQTPPGTSGQQAPGGAVPQSVPASVGRGPGPIMEHPEVFALYWGQAFASSPNFVAAMNVAVQALLDPAYSRPLQAYGVDTSQGRFLGSTVVGDDPPSDVGNANFVALSAQVTTNSDTPKVWFAVGGHDPLVALFVPEDKVDHSGWDGYHFGAPTPADFIPFPFNFLVHDILPWLVVKVPSAALNVPAFFNRRLCFDTPSNPGCNLAGAFDDATTRLAHEFVEIVTDPYPFTAWADLGKPSIASDSEIADVCHESSAPWASDVFVRYGSIGFEFATYWINGGNPNGEGPELAGACVPESRPTVRLRQPCDELLEGPCDTVRVEQTPTGAFFEVVTFDSTLRTPTVTWRIVENGVTRHGTGVYLPFPTPGVYTVEATSTNGAASRVRRVRVQVDARPPVTVQIVRPGDGFAIAIGDTITPTIDYAYAGAVGEGAFRWSIDGRQVATGASPSLRFASGGDTALSVTLIDDLGRIATSSITLHVLRADQILRVTITQPPHDADCVQTTGDSFDLAAVTTDAQGQPVNNAVLTWDDDADGRLGIGPALHAALSCGEHHVRVTARDPQGRIGNDVVSLCTCVVP